MKPKVVESTHGLVGAAQGSRFEVIQDPKKLAITDFDILNSTTGGTAHITSYSISLNPSTDPKKILLKISQPLKLLGVALWLRDRLRVQT